VYWGFFSGGARNVHTDTILALKEQGIDHRVLHYYDVLDRGDEGTQRAVSDANYKKLRNAGISIESLAFDTIGQIDPYAPLEEFSGDPSPADPQEKAVRALALHLAELPSSTILCLKEQPVHMLVLANRYLEEVLKRPSKPIIITLHRTDPGLQDVKAMDVLRGLENNPATKRYIAGYIACAESSAIAYQQALGLEGEDARFLTVPNGINLDIFHPVSEEAKSAFIASHFLPNEAPHLTSPIVTLGARNSPEKNPALFLAAAWQFLANNPHAHVALCGTGMTDVMLAPIMSDTLEKSGLSKAQQNAVTKRIHCLGKLSSKEMATLCSMSKVMALTSPTLGEADPLVLKEGMACGATPVSTSTGDTPAIVGIADAKHQMLKPIDHGFEVGSRGILTSQDPADIAQAWEYAIAHPTLFHENHKIFTPLLDRTLMGNGYRVAIERLEAEHRKAYPPSPIISNCVSRARLGSEKDMGIDF